MDCYNHTHTTKPHLIKLKYGVVRGIPKLEKNEPGICGPCQVGKQLKGSHEVLQQITTTRVLELLWTSWDQCKLKVQVVRDMSLCVLIIFSNLLGLTLLKRNLTHLMRKN